MANNPAGSSSSNNNGGAWDMSSLRQTLIPGLTLLAQSQDVISDLPQPSSSDTPNAIPGLTLLNDDNDDVATRSRRSSASYHPSPPPSYVWGPDDLAATFDTMALEHHTPSAVPSLTESQAAAYENLYDHDYDNVQTPPQPITDNDMDTEMDQHEQVFGLNSYDQSFETVEIIGEARDDNGDMWYRLRGTQIGASEAGYDCVQEWDELAHRVKYEVAMRWFNYKAEQLAEVDVDAMLG